MTHTGKNAGFLDDPPQRRMFRLELANCLTRMVAPFDRGWTFPSDFRLLGRLNPLLESNDAAAIQWALQSRGHQVSDDAIIVLGEAFTLVSRDLSMLRAGYGEAAASSDGLQSEHEMRETIRLTYARELADRGSLIPKEYPDLVGRYLDALGDDVAMSMLLGSMLDRFVEIYEECCRRPFTKHQIREFESTDYQTALWFDLAEEQHHIGPKDLDTPS